MYEYRRVAGEHIVRVAYSRPARRVTYSDMPLTWESVDRNRVGARPRAWLTATVTATRTDTSARHRTPNGPGTSPVDASAPSPRMAPPRSRTTTPGAAQAYKEATPPAPRALCVALRPPYGHPLTAEATTGPAAAETTGQAPDGALPASAPPTSRDDRRLSRNSQ